MHKRFYSALVLLLFTLSLAFLGRTVLEQQLDLSTVEFVDKQHNHHLKTHHNTSSDEYYLFLPSYADLDDLSASIPWYLNIYYETENGRYFDMASLPHNERIFVSLSLPLNIGARYYSLRLLPCSAEQTIFIEMKDGVLEYLEEDKERKSGVDISFLNENGQVEYSGYCDMSGRGNGTWTRIKKPYTLSFSQPISVGDFQQIDSLCLLAEYSDHSKLRNAIGHYAGQILDFPYATAYSFTDVYINGSYHGLYGLATKQEYRKHLVSDGISQVFEQTRSRKENSFKTHSGKWIRVYHGSANVIHDKLDQFETALAAQDWDLVFQHIDLDSWCLKWALDEILGNWDMTWASQYFYIDRNDRIHYMLPWDFEWTMYARFEDMQAKDEPSMASYWNEGSWYEALMESSKFRQTALHTLKSQITPLFFSELSNYAKVCVEEIYGSWKSDLSRWDKYYDPTSSDEELTAYPAVFSEYFPSRLNYLENVLEKWEDYCRVSFFSQKRNQLDIVKRQLFIPKGSDFTQYHPSILDSAETVKGYVFDGWITDSGISLSEISVINQDLTLIAQYTPVTSAKSSTSSQSTSPDNTGLIATFVAYFHENFISMTLLSCFLCLFFLLAIKEAWKILKQAKQNSRIS